MPKPSSVSTGAAAALSAALLIAGCGPGSDRPADDASLTVYVSLPLRGAAGVDGRDAADGARLALADSGVEAGGVAVRAVFLDDTEGERPSARWTPAKAGANARAATQDSSAIAYIGDFASGATRTSLPVTNAAGLLQVSPASGAGDLTAPFVGSDELPEAQPSGERTFGRVIPSDAVQAAAAATWAREVGLEGVRVLSDGTPFGRELSSAFEAAAATLGLEQGGPNPLLYLAGTPRPPGGEEIGSDAYLQTAGPRPGRVTSAALAPAQLPAAGREFAASFADEYGRRPGSYAAYGYEAMALALDSIDRASDPTDRAAVIDAFFATVERDSVLGVYSIDELGETTLDRLSGYQLKDGELRLAVELRPPTS